jgi:hypothetical protein
VTDKSYQDRLRAHSFESRVDPLRDAVRHALAVWHQEDDQEKNDLSEAFWRAMGELEAVLKSVKRGGEEDVPEVEVADDRSPTHVEAPQTPVAARRSGAKNVSAPEYQNAFISEARASMGMPLEQEAEAMVGKYVILVFNIDKPPVRGTLTAVTTHPSGAPSYLILDDDDHSRYPLNSVQSIKEAP